MRYTVKTIPHERQDYETEGNYKHKNGHTKIWVSEYPDDRVNFIVFIHEAVEEYLTRYRGIKEEDITRFDIESGLDDPGLSRKACYHKEHMFAVQIEKLLCKELKMSYKQYYNTRPYGSSHSNTKRKPTRRKTRNTK